MKRCAALIALLLAFTIVHAQGEPPLLPGLYEAESSSLQPYYSGSGWAQLVDGDYTAMDTSSAGDSVSFSVSGSQLVIYRELLAEDGATAEICIDAVCSTFTNTSSIDQRGVPIAYPISDETTVTITNSDAGILRLDSFLILEGRTLATVEPPDPARSYVVLADGQIAAFDRSITGGDVLQLAFSAAQIVLLLVVVVVVKWKQ